MASAVAYAGPGSLPFMVALLLISAAVPVHACAEGEIALFSCITQDELNAIQLCAMPDDEGQTYRGLRYVSGSDEREELSFPDEPTEAAQRLRFAHHFESELYHWSLVFETGGLRYRLFGDGDDAGVEISDDRGQVETIGCGERPVSYPEDVRKSAGCDPATIAGEQGCLPDAPELK